MLRGAAQALFERGLGTVVGRPHGIGSRFGNPGRFDLNCDLEQTTEPGAQPALRVFLCGFCVRFVGEAVALPHLLQIDPVACFAAASHFLYCSSWAFAALSERAFVSGTSDALGRADRELSFVWC